jgi:serine protease Do
MKGRSLISTLFIALFGALAGLFIYTRFLDKKDIASGSDKDKQAIEASARYTALPGQEGFTDFTYAAENTVHGVVHVKIKATVDYGLNNPLYEFFYGQEGSSKHEVQGFGSGVIISSDGYIVTNNHVIDEADEVEVTLNDKRTFDAKIIGRDPSTDIALMKIKAENLPFIRFGDSDAIKLGQWVLAVGNPFNLTSTVTAGIVSAKGRSLGLLDNQYRIESFIQTDAALNPGNSGGALVNTQGELIGITSAIISPSGAYAGNSFAVPSSIVKKVVEDLKQFGEVQRGLLGVNIEDVTSDIAKDEKLDAISGVYLSGVNSDGAAAAAGLEKGDIIVAVNDQSVATSSDLQEKINRYRPGDKIKVGFLHKGKRNEANVTLRNVDGGTGIVAPGSLSSTVFGASVSAVSPDAYEQYNISNGVMITSVSEGRFKSLGLGRGTIIISVNGQKVNSAADIRKASDNEKSLTSIEGFTPDGTYFKYQTRK